MSRMIQININVCVIWFTFGKILYFPWVFGKKTSYGKISNSICSLPYTPIQKIQNLCLLASSGGFWGNPLCMDRSVWPGAQNAQAFTNVRAPHIEISSEIWPTNACGAAAARGAMAAGALLCHWLWVRGFQVRRGVPGQQQQHQCGRQLIVSAAGANVGQNNSRLCSTQQ